VPAERRPPADPPRLGIKTSPQAVDWATLDAAWARIGEHEVFDSVWMNDHLTDIAHDRHGPSLEALTAMAALVHRVPGRWVGHAVLSNTFRHPAVLAKAATVLDHATRGRFIVGLGAGWHEGEHRPFGIDLQDMPERFDRFESAVHTLLALWSAAGATPPGVTRDDPFYPLHEATNEPPAHTSGGPSLYLGGQKRRGIALAAAVADGWLLPAIVSPGNPADLDYFSERRDALLAAMDAIGRDPADFAIVAQVGTGRSADDRAWALEQARDALRRGATGVILGMPPQLGAAGVDAVAHDVAEPLRDALGR
jgi:alkanesulfonate monooxygenase SsuD/methylene tetrahydromethanopterin reductase-like flavin-dependent oxidoreductase (luciferase family)